MKDGVERELGESLNPGLEIHIARFCSLNGLDKVVDLRLSQLVDNFLSNRHRPRLLHSGKLK